MENYVGGQLACLGQALLLGLVGGAVYDLLRAIRIRWRSRWLTHASDVLYVLALGLAVFLFTMGRGQGELRLYVLGGIALGGVVYFTLLSALVRPLWSFWTETAALLAGFLWRPVAWGIDFTKKVADIAKKYFYFWRKYATIMTYSLNYRGSGKAPEGGRGHAKREKSKKMQKKQKA